MDIQEKNRVEEMKSRMEEETGLRVVKVDSAPALEAWLANGLRDLYKNAFAEPPYCEKFSDEEVDDIFRAALGGRGCLLLAVDPACGDLPAALTMSVSLARAGDALARVSGGYDPDKTSYCAEVAVDSRYRRHGLSGRLNRIMLEENACMGVTNVLLRTSAQNYRQISATAKAGASMLRGAFDIAVRNGLDGSTRQDKSVFFVFDVADYARASSRVSVLPGIVVAAEKDGDVAYAGEEADAARRQALSDMIREGYPGVTRVVFGAAANPGGTLFDGRMYFDQSWSGCNDNAPPAPARGATPARQ